MRLQGKLLLVIVPIIALSLLTLGMVAYNQLRENSKQEYLREMKLVLNQSNLQTQSYIKTTVANVESYSNSNLIKQYMRTSDKVYRYHLLQPALIKAFSSYRKIHPDYEEIRLLLPNGFEDTRLAARGIQNNTEHEGDTEWFKKLPRSAHSYFVNIGPSPDTGSTTLLVARPITLSDQVAESDAAESSLRGFFAVTTNLKFLAQLVEQHRIGESGYMMITDHNGKILFHKNSNMINTQPEGLAKVLVEQTRTKATEKIDFSDGTNLVHSQWLFNGLVFVAVLPEAEYVAASRKIAIAVAAVTLFAILLTSILFYLCLRTMVLRPIQRLRSNAVAIGEGQLDTQIDIGGNDEIGDLAGAFREMNHKLSSSMSELQDSHAQIEHLAYRDSLTGLPNRRLFVEYVENAVTQAHQNSTELAVLFLDLDDFKRVNDTMGHEAGDILLQTVAKRLQKCVRSSDSITHNILDHDGSNPVARLGGDEFTILLTNMATADNATIVAKRIITALQEPIELGGREFFVGTSIGIAMYPTHANDMDALIKCADTAMYEAKRQQKNTFRVYSESMQTDLDKRLRIEDDLRRALSNGELLLHYQPQYNTESNTIIGVEALVRWMHPQIGMIPPNDFIPVAEEAGLIAPLGEWVMLEACRQWKEWDRQGFAPSRIAVNVSHRQFALGDVLELVQRSLRSHSIEPNVLELELTESCMMVAESVVFDILSDLRTEGVRIAMDDFGTGYSSLAVLTSLPIDTLKIDRKFITDIDKKTQNDKVVTAVLMLAQGLELEVVAEGVETEDEYNYLCERKCDIAQGYFLSRPLAADKVTELLHTQHNKMLSKAS